MCNLRNPINHIMMMFIHSEECLYYNHHYSVINCNNYSVTVHFRLQVAS